MAVVKCPTCGTPVRWDATSAFRPFCSERCKNVDLGAWASERYAIGGDTKLDERDGDEPG
jgi:endogenous inhibitor of DNA gyrase (YacG/DUF329 family)